VNIVLLEMGDFNNCPLLLRSLAQASSYNHSTPLHVPAKIIQRPLRRAQLAFNSRRHTMRHPLASVTCHYQTLVDEVKARPLTAALFTATFSSGNKMSNGYGCSAVSNCLLSTLHLPSLLSQ
jgi:hypothetical protein